MTLTARYLLSFLVPLAAAAALTPLLGRGARRLGILDHPGDHKIHRRAIPYLGGLAVAGGVLLVVVIDTALSAQVLTILLCAVAVALLGLVDDWVHVGPLPKLLVEGSTGIALWSLGIRAGLFGNPALDLALTILWVVAITNAMNLVDNMDGLASGLAAISSLGLFAIAAARGDYLVGSLALATAGAAIGFLWHNFHPAKIFLGDAGSLFLGFLLASIGLKLDLVGPTGFQRSVIAVLTVAVCLFDMFLVTWVRLREHRPVYLGATDHSSHRLAARGLSPRSIALGAYAAQLICSALAFGLSRVEGDELVTGAIVISGAVALVAFGVLLRMAPLVVQLPEAGGTLGARPPTHPSEERT